MGLSSAKRLSNSTVHSAINPSPTKALLDVLEGPTPGTRSLRCLQDARKGIQFEDFPPVLQLQLKRFEYNFQHDSHVKVVEDMCPVAARQALQPAHQQLVLPHVNAAMPKQAAHGANAPAGVQSLVARLHIISAALLKPLASTKAVESRRFSFAWPALQINDRYEFPEQLDLDYGHRRFLAKEADQSVRNLYKLHSVLVHRGDVHGGHCCAFIRPDGKQWLKFDDDRVSTVQGPAQLFSGRTSRATCTFTPGHPGCCTRARSAQVPNLHCTGPGPSQATST